LALRRLILDNDNVWTVIHAPTETECYLMASIPA
jgi:hypothetical protein